MSPTDPPPRLRMLGVQKRFGATRALAGVDLTVAAGEILALVGENGAGKSTLMKVLSGAHPPDAGQMWLDGEPYRPRNPHDARRAGVAMIYQELALAPHLTAAENIVLGTESTAGPFVRRAEAHRRAAAALARLGRPELPLDIPVARLAMPERQLVEIARAVAVGCRVLVLDEPTSSLAKRDADRLFELVRRLRDSGTAVIYISHFLEEVKAIADRVTILRDGLSVATARASELSETQIVSLMVGRSVDELYPRSPRHPGSVALDVTELTASRGKPAGASLVLHSGEVLGIAGLIGAGRTELLRALFGLDAVRGGRVRVGHYTGAASPARRWAQGVGLVSEDRKTEGLALDLSLADNLTLSSLRPFVRPSRQNAAARLWIDRLGIRCRTPVQKVRDLSGGNQQKLAIARLLHRNVDVLLLDEPTRGIDVASKAQIYKLIDDLAAAGKAVLMVSSYLPELLGVCDRIAVMCKGRLGPARPVAQTSEHRIMTEAIGGASVDSDTANTARHQ